MRTLLVVGLALFFLPGVAADHVYSHRYVIEGRLVGTDGLPIAHRLIQPTFVGESMSTACSEGQTPITDDQGDFRLCYHTHALNASALIGVSGGNVNASLPIDVALRHSAFLLQDPDYRGKSSVEWNDTYRITGRVWRVGPTILEGVAVDGLALPNVAVNLTLTTGADHGSQLQVFTDGYGDYSATLRLVNGANVSNTTVSLTTLGYQENVALDPVSHRSLADLTLPATAGVGPAPVARPGTATPPASPLLVTGVGLALLASIWMGRKKLR